jgi:glycosyltransferase involved in cell wall biosynthesis
MNEISVAIIAKNEEKRLPAALESAKWADEIVVVDAQSNDRTAEIARSYGAKVFERPFDNFAEQKNYAVSCASKPWVFSLDADERISKTLAEELRRHAQDSQARAGYFVRRNNYFFGRCLKHGGQGEDKQMRLFRKDRARYHNVVHEEVSIDGSTGILNEKLAHYSCDDLEDYFRKFMHYTDLEARQAREQGVPFRWHNLLLKPWARFFYTYIWKGGFWDGYQGFLFHSFSAFYAFVKVAKLRENRR